MKRIVATFYRTAAGNEPVRNWLQALAKQDRMIVGVDIATVEFGWPLGMPVCRPLRDQVLEVRSTIKAGLVEARTYFSIEGDRMLLLHGKDGKSGQNEAIELAISRLSDHRRHQAESLRKRGGKP